ncbi:CopG family transcriptional regulator [Sphingopyxis sp. R3-92]|uniref:CopG family transcriptional regulator n=1 Tax=Sphingopyxis sp. R3-92 TaxID=3158553 RepID=UPI003EE426E6
MKRAHVKQTYRLDAELARLVAERARQRRVTKTEVVEAALASVLSPDHEERIEAIVTRRLDRITRLLDRLLWHVDLSNETVALFVRFWLTSTPPSPDAGSKGAQATGAKRYRSFVDSLSRRMEDGPRLKDELSEDYPAALEEKGGIARRDQSPSEK